jgi:hypothetical protein
MRISDIPIEKYEQAMREEICSMCPYFSQQKESTRCVQETSGECSLFANLKDVVEVVSQVDSGSIEPYVRLLRQEVCATCEHQDDRGVCEIRDSREPLPRWCVLDAYFNIIVGAIEDVQARETAVT